MDCQADSVTSQHFHPCFSIRVSGSLESTIVTHRPIPPKSRQHAPKFRDALHRELQAKAFSSEVDDYHRVRPRYPEQVFSLIPQATRIIDVGCGTGIFSEQLAQAFPHAKVIGSDLSKEMLTQFRHHHQLPCIQAKAEALGLVDASVDLISCAQTWHWLDPVAASSEFARVLRPDGVVVLLWNTLDVAVPWVHRLTRITHAGDTLAEGFVPNIGKEFAIERTLRCRFSQTLPVADLHTLMHTRSYWLRASPNTRAKMTSNLDWYIDHLGLDPEGEVTLPYRHDAFVLRRRA
ncbi:hypothetical protein CPELA_05875 [Corynebacterium pelargi]|uniref:Methyltransferase type 11 domain-containing protein n=1 Tax=Corynebacterium pelargi TaxID=1471400 RepID=A0A410W907_9CORY|nr:hypothetical protein CPELA_05875 [Corynebacterium pelargi]